MNYNDTEQSSYYVGHTGSGLSETFHSAEGFDDGRSGFVDEQPVASQAAPARSAAYEDDSLLAGNEDLHESPEKKKARQKKWDDYVDELNRKKEAEKTDKDDTSRNGDDKEDEQKRGKGSWLYEKWLGITDHGDWISITHLGQRDPKDGMRRTMSEKQLKALLVKLVLDKGWTNVYFYNSRTKEINKQLTSQAEAMLQELMLPGGPLAGMAPPRFADQRMSYVNDPKNEDMQIEPWEKGIFEGFHRLEMKWRNMGQRSKLKRQSRSAGRKNQRIAKNMGLKDKAAPDHKTLKRQEREARRNAREEAKDKRQKNITDSFDEKSIPGQAAGNSSFPDSATAHQRPNIPFDEDAAGESAGAATKNMTGPGGVPAV